jgi:PadR family transcriptional regulator PadR
MSVQRDLFLGFVKIHILYHAGKEGVTGVWLSSELTRHGYSISPGTLYPTLRKLERSGYLASASRVEDGHRRVYYRLTKKGEKALDRARLQARELLEEIEGHA